MSKYNVIIHLIGPVRQSAIYFHHFLTPQKPSWLMLTTKLTVLASALEAKYDETRAFWSNIALLNNAIIRISQRKVHYLFPSKEAFSETNIFNTCQRQLVAYAEYSPDNFHCK
jgi:hypothetical protein